MLPGPELKLYCPANQGKALTASCFALPSSTSWQFFCPHHMPSALMKLVPFTSKSVSYFDDLQIIFQSKSCLNFPVLVLVHGRNTICNNHETRSKQNSMSCRLRHSDCRTQALTKDSQRYTLHLFQFSNNSPKQRKVHSFWCVNHGQ